MRWLSQDLCAPYCSLRDIIFLVLVAVLIQNVKNVCACMFEWFVVASAGTSSSFASDLTIVDSVKDQATS